MSVDKDLLMINAKMMKMKRGQHREFDIVRSEAFNFYGFRSVFLAKLKMKSSQKRYMQI